MAKKTDLVIVESPGKIKKIQGFLGSGYKVVASYGHIRDLSKGAKGIDKKNNFTPHYSVSPDKKDVVKNLKKLAKDCDIVYLAQDQDREGEAISFHVKEVLGLSEKKYERIVFTEITKKAIEDAIKNPRKIDMDLVNAQQARRVLDRLVGFDLSPLLWQKVQKGLSAGRVQSVALKLISEKEKEVKGFSTSSDFKANGNFNFKNSKIKSILNKRFKDKDKSRELLEKCIGKEFSVTKVEKKPGKKTSQAPFTTSTLQQIANRNLGFSVDRTMKVAQKLYESGHITYMRTDSVILSEDFLKETKDEIETKYGKKYLNLTRYTNKNKSAQEAHEAIRPTHIEINTTGISDEETRLYELIWRRTIASQMTDAQVERTIVNINTKGVPETFVAKGEVLTFDGFLKVYKEKAESDKEDNEEDNNSLPPIAKDDILETDEIKVTESFKKHPPRFSESSLVKKLEELGVGRPSTYASIISTIQKRNYVKIDNVKATERKIYTFLLKNDNISEETKVEKFGAEKKKLIPSDIGMVVNDFLSKGFKDVINYNFTANVENEFDEIAAGKKDWNKMIVDFYTPFHEKVKEFAGSNDRAADIELGEDPVTGKRIIARIGRFGPMIQMGKADDEQKPKYAKLKEDQSINTITLAEALELLKWPRILGEHNKEQIDAANGKFGPYVKYKKKFYSLTDLTAETVTLKQAIEVIKEKDEIQKKRVIKEFKSEDISVLNGQYGPYISCKKKNYKIPEFIDAQKITLKECVDLMKKKKTYKKKSN